jgi:PPK2 family polyphosphate:nucleotide phosphotransferase
MKLEPVSPRAQLRLSDAEAVVDKDELPDDLDEALDEQRERIVKLQRAFYADARFALLIVLQGRDASGKDGVIRKVFEGVNPEGIETSSFKVPSDFERRHDFLWRIHQRVPARNKIGIFNRSHYEDVLAARVHGIVTKKTCTSRYEQINEFERMLSCNNVVILKFFLHISKAEQKKRLLERLEDPKKNWKFNPGDLEDRARWAQYTIAYRDAIRNCTTKWAPWYVVPADHEKTRSWLVARTVADTLDDLDLRYPRADPAVLKMEIK